ncbi:MAG: ABC transporter permease [Pseudobdellovibrionaceae bacterium]
MTRYLGRRLALSAFALVGVLSMSFLLLHLVPGDPVEMMLGEKAPAEDKENLRKSLGLDQPLASQYLHYLSRLAVFDMGRSLAMRTPVSLEVRQHALATLELALGAMVFALLWGIPAGVWAAASAGKTLDHILGVVALFGMSVPGVFLGPLLIYLFAVRLDWFPVSDRGTWAHLILPALSLALPLGAVLLRITRAAMIEVLNEDYIRTAKSKGLSKSIIFFRHALGNAMIPVLTTVGLQTAAVMTGTVITETIFDWPGLGSLLYTAIQRRDYPLVQGTVLVVAALYVLINFLTDLSYGLVDPRIRQSEAG